MRSTPPSPPPHFASTLTPLDVLSAKWLSKGGSPKEGWLPKHSVNSATCVVSIVGENAVPEKSLARKKGLGLKHGDDRNSHGQWN